MVIHTVCGGGEGLGLDDRGVYEDGMGAHCGINFTNSIKHSDH